MPERSENIGLSRAQSGTFNDSLENIMPDGRCHYRRNHIFIAVCIGKEIAEMPDGKETLNLEPVVCVCQRAAEACACKNPVS